MVSQIRPLSSTASFRLIRKLMIVILALAGLSYATVVVFKFHDRHLLQWLPAYFARQGESDLRHPVTDVLLMVADHWEPGNHPERVSEWLEAYPKLFGDIRDSDGRPPQHTFFYPADQFRGDQVLALSKLAQMGFGEIELQLHHHDDTSITLRAKIRKAKQQFGEYGALRTADGRAAFGFVHGNWALDNSAFKNGKNLCGVNDELNVLWQEGAFADFTFPAYGTTAQPSGVDEFCYAVDNPESPKSYDPGIRMAVGQRPPSGALLIMQGPIAIRWSDFRNALWPMVDFAQIETDAAPDISRFQTWLKTNVHVDGRPEWVFIKNHTHAGSRPDMSLFLSKQMVEFYRSTLEYAHQRNMRVHFVTAREFYNIAKAAEAGKSGNPNDYRNYVIPPYANRMDPPDAPPLAIAHPTLSTRPLF